MSEIDLWMTNNKLKLNIDKTEVVLLSAAHRPRPAIDSLRFSEHNSHLFLKFCSKHWGYL